MWPTTHQSQHPRKQRSKQPRLLSYPNAQGASFPVGLHGFEWKGFLLLFLRKKMTNCFERIELFTLHGSWQHHRELHSETTEEGAHFQGQRVLKTSFPEGKFMGKPGNHAETWHTDPVTHGVKGPRCGTSEALPPHP